MKKLISSGSDFEKSFAYSRAVVQDNWVFVSGTTGYDYRTMTISDDVASQTQQCFENIAVVLKQAGCGMQDVVRINYILPNKNDFASCSPVIQNYLKKVKPAATMIEAGLLDDAMKIEIEVTAMIPSDH